MAHRGPVPPEMREAAMARKVACLNYLNAHIGEWCTSNDIAAHTRIPITEVRTTLSALKRADAVHYRGVKGCGRDGHRSVWASNLTEAPAFPPN